MTDDPVEFEYGQPFEIDSGRAAVIAEELRANGYPRCFADEVTAELARQDSERSVIGRVAAEMLRSAGCRP